MSSKDYELTRAGLFYVMDCIREADWKALYDKGFRERHIRALQCVTLSDMSRLNEYVPAHLMNVGFDPEGFLLLVAQMQQASKVEQLKQDMIERDAPADMMSELFSMSRREYTAMRRALDRPSNTGRPANPDTDMMDAIWFAWGKHCGHRREPDTPEEWLALADGAGVDLGVVWRFVKTNPLHQPA